MRVDGWRFRRGVNSGGRFYSTVPDSEKRECWLEENGRRKKKKLKKRKRDEEEGKERKGVD